MHAMGFLIFVGCCNTKRLQDLKWPDECSVTWQRSGWPKEIHRQAQEKHANQIHWHFSKVSKKMQVGWCPTSFAILLLSVWAYCLHSHPKNKSGNPPTNPLGFLYAHGCGCPWFPSLAPYRSSVFWSSVFLCKNLLLRFKKMSPLKDRVGAWNSWRPVPSTGTGAPSLKVRLLHPPSRSLRGFR